VNARDANGRQIQYAPKWPKGTKQRLTRQLAKRFFELLSTSEKSVFGLLCDHPELPPHSQLFNWRARYPWFSEAWDKARREQGEFLAQRCLDFAQDTTPENAHAQRLKSDIYWRIASKFFPSVYGDKPVQSNTTNVSIGVSLSQERLTELQAKLEATRSHFAATKTLSNGQSVKENKPVELIQG
jgi:hypothetical protein